MRGGPALITVGARMRRLLVTAIAIGALLALPAAAAARLPAVLTQLKPPFQLRPAVISYTGDGTGLVGGRDGRSVRHPGHLRWKRYTRRRGIGRGLLWLNDCRPSCAGGRFHSTPVKVRASSPRHGHFRRLRLTYRYRGKRYTDHRRVRRHPDGPSYYGIRPRT